MGRGIILSLCILAGGNAFAQSSLSDKFKVSQDQMKQNKARAWAEEINTLWELAVTDVSERFGWQSVLRDDQRREKRTLYVSDQDGKAVCRLMHKTDSWKGRHIDVYCMDTESNRILIVGEASNDCRLMSGDEIVDYKTEKSREKREALCAR